MKKIIFFTFIFFLFEITVIIHVRAEEYWKDYFHQVDRDNFDSPPMMFNEISKEQSAGVDTYTVIERSSAGEIVESLSILKGKPNYYYSYIFSNGRLIARNLYYFDGEQEKPLSDVLYSYDEDGKLICTAYYTYSLGKKKMVYTKVYYGSNYVIYDYSPLEHDDRVLRALESVEREIIKLQKLEKRGLIEKILGWE